jgi:hypothetical protein
MLPAPALRCLHGGIRNSDIRLQDGTMRQLGFKHHVPGLSWTTDTVHLLSFAADTGCRFAEHLTVSCVAGHKSYTKAT